MASIELGPPAWQRSAAGSTAAAAMLIVLACTAPPPEGGAVVESCVPLGTAALAGLQPGDILVSWGRDAARGFESAGGPIDTPLRLRLVEGAESPIGPVTLHLLRRGVPEMATVEGGEWKLSLRPQLPGPAERTFLRAVDAAEVGDIEAAVRIWQRLAEELNRSSRLLDAAFCWLRIGFVQVEDRQWEEAGESFATARSLVGEPALVAVIQHLQGVALDGAGRYGDAESVHARALELRHQLDRDSGAVAESLRALARSRLNRDNTDQAAPLQQALDIYRGLDNAAAESADALNLLAIVADSQGRLVESEDLHRQALRVLDDQPAGSATKAKLLGNLGLSVHSRGDLATAERLYRQALEIEEQIDPEGMRAAYILNYLGVLAKDSGDDEHATVYYRRALEIFERQAPGREEEAGMLNNLGIIALRRGDLAVAERYQRRGLALRTVLLPDSLSVAASLANLGTILLRRGELEEARELLQRSLELKERLAPRSLVLANTITSLAKLAAQQGDLARTVELNRRALRIRRTIAPGTAIPAQSLFLLGDMAHRQGQSDQAETHWREAISMIEGQAERLQLTADERSIFAAPFHRFYRELATLLWEKGREREAFDLLERARARALRSMLAQRDFSPATEVPAELTFERRRLERDLDRARSQLSRLDPVTDARELQALRGQLLRLRIQRDELATRIRAASPRLTRLEEPTATDLDAVGEHLDPGTLLLSYSIGEKSTLLFAVTAGSGSRSAVLETHVLPAGASELTQRVDIIRSLIERGRRLERPERALLIQAARLYDLLLAPVEAAAEDAERLLLVTEGPLSTLPFSALVRSQDPLEYVAQWRPLHFAASAGVFVELASGRSSRPSSTRFVGFGDPNGDHDSSVTEGRRFLPLPAGRDEVTRIAELFPDSSIALGRQATESLAKEWLRSDVRYLHFASHTLLDPRFPLDSAIALAPPLEDTPTDRDNGLLHAWEIIEELRLDADLVTLSACDSGLGKEVTGEGLVGLARAFQYAGARSLLASLWAVSDRSTAELMVEFYAHLERGDSKDIALQTAQRRLIEGPPTVGGIEARHPFHWAGFRLIGDWQ